ncbi:MAG: hypothetical protein RMJ17_03805 [Candidatus Aenigmarchaeota archaeon]|nr:hypothetical protein [Candidatus Aenigmarchaeota archaeon]MDW8149687.1 hypothetical protein [Candidatus Aenigmarchaeota archaeon]
MKINKIAVFGIYVALFLLIIIKPPIFSIDFIGKKFYYRINESDFTIIENRLKSKNIYYRAELEDNNLIVESPEKPKDYFFRKCEIKIYLERDAPIGNFSIKNYTDYFFEYDKLKFLLLNSSEIKSINLTSKTAIHDKINRRYLIVGIIVENIKDLDKRLSSILENFEIDLNNVIRGSFVYTIDNETFGNVEISSVIRPNVKELLFVISDVNKKIVEERAKIVEVCGKSNVLNSEVKYLKQEFVFGNLFHIFLISIIILFSIPLIAKKFDLYKEVLIFLAFISFLRIMNEEFGLAPVVFDLVIIISSIVYLILRLKESLIKKFSLHIILIAVIISFFPLINKAGLALLFFSISSSIKNLFDKIG